jgi:hypothetical protein
MKYDINALTDTRPTRRTVTRAAAWSVPVIAVASAAPAFAASPCDPRTGQRLDWDGSSVAYTRTSNTVAKAVLDPDGPGPVPALTLDVTAGYAGNMKSGYENPGTNTPHPNFRVSSPVGGLGVSGLSLWQATTSDTPQGRSDRGTYTFTLSRPVSNLQFTITDIDSQSGDFWDVVQLAPGYSVVSQAGTLSSDNNGIGGAQRFYASGQSAPVDNTSGTGGNLTVRYAGPVSVFSITYWNGAASFDTNVDQDQAVYISDLTFDYKPC